LYGTTEVVPTEATTVEKNAKRLVNKGKNLTNLYGLLVEFSQFCIRASSVHHYRIG